MKPLFLFAPGAGTSSAHRWMQNWKARLGMLGEIETFDYSYMREGRKRPDPLPQLVAAHRQALRDARERHPSRSIRHRTDSPWRTILIGKSMGGRVGCHVSLQENVDGLICLGYPLCAMGDRTKLRDEVLLALTRPVLFVQGTRDSLCPVELLEQVRREMSAPNFLHIVEGGDHSLIVAKRQLREACQTQEEIDRQILEAISVFLSKLAGVGQGCPRV